MKLFNCFATTVSINIDKKKTEIGHRSIIFQTVFVHTWFLEKSNYLSSFKTLDMVFLVGLGLMTGMGVDCKPRPDFDFFFTEKASKHICQVNKIV